MPSKSMIKVWEGEKGRVGQAALAEGVGFVGPAYSIDDFVLPVLQERLQVLGGEYQQAVRHGLFL